MKGGFDVRSWCCGCCSGGGSGGGGALRFAIEACAGFRPKVPAG